MNGLKMEQTRKKLSEKLKRYRELKKQRGMTLLEIIIVLGIIGTIAAGVVILAQRAYDNKAMSDLTNNINTIRTAMKEAYGSTGIYPVPAGATTVQLNDQTITAAAGQVTPIGKLIALGKLSRDEAKNNISGDFISVGGANISTSGIRKGYFIEINGLNQQQCRSILLQAGNSFDYVQTVTGDLSGNYNVKNNLINLNSALTQVTKGTPAKGTTPGTPDILKGQGVFRSLAANGNTLITADGVVSACSDNSSNGIILGSR